MARPTTDFHRDSSRDSLDEVKRRILTRVDLQELLGETVQFLPRSGKLAACCPFHAEKSASFYLYDDHYYCFGCKIHGDAIHWVREKQGLGFVEALRWLAAKFGVETPELDESKGRMSRLRQDASLHQIMGEAQLFYQTQLETTEGQPAREYLLRRGFKAESLKDFGFGATPPEPFGLTKHLRNKGFREEDLITVALSTSSANTGRPYDFFRQRLTLPIHDAQGRVIAFGARALGDAQPKYLNSRDTALFDKSRTLFGFDKARTVMREKQRAIVVEGYMDALMLRQQGFPETVACLGTALTEHHLKLLKNATSQVILLFDGDAAGQRATLAAVSVALTIPEIHIKAVALPQGEDPDSFVLKHGAEALSEVLAKAQDLLDFAVSERLKTTHRLAIPELVSGEIVPWLARIGDRIQRGTILHRLSFLIGVPAQQIEGPLAAALAVVGDAQMVARNQAAIERARGPIDGVGRAGAVHAVKPLDPATLGFFGQVYFAAPGEADTTELATFARKDLELDDAHTLFLQEILGRLERGLRPADEAPDSFVAAAEPVVMTLIDRLRKAEPAFAGGDRKVRLQSVMAAFHERRVKSQISDLKAELHRLASMPDAREAVQRVVAAIQALAKSR